MISDKIKGLLAMSGRKEVELAAYFGISPQSMHNKFSRGSFSGEDLIKIADFLGVSFGFTLEDGQQIKLDKSDLRNK